MLLKSYKIIEKRKFHIILKRSIYKKDIHPCYNCDFLEHTEFKCLLYKLYNSEIYDLRELCLDEFNNSDFYHTNYIYHPHVVKII